LNASGTGSHSSSSCGTILTSHHSDFRGCVDLDGNSVAMSDLPSVDMKESFDGCLASAFVDGHRRGLSSDSEWSSRRSLILSGIVPRSSSRSLLWILSLLLLVLNGRGGGGEVQRILVII